MPGKLTREGKEKVNQELTKIAIKAVRNAKNLAPVDTGRLRSSITFNKEIGASGLAKIFVGSNVSYAPLQEFGTENMPAQPFLRPGLRQAISEFDGSNVRFNSNQST